MKPFPVFHEAETLRPHNECKVEVNAIEDGEKKRKMPRLMHADSDEEDEAEDRRQGRGREETDEEAAKRRKFVGESEGAGDREASSEGGEHDEVHSEQDAGYCRKMKKLVNPRLPSREEVEAHEMTHLPFRNWCPHCVKGRGVESPPKSGEGRRGNTRGACGFLLPGECGGERPNANGGRRA